MSKIKLAPDLVAYIKLLARKRDALVMGRQESDDKKYSLTVYESLSEVTNVDDKVIGLIRKKDGGILVKKSLLEMSEMSVFFWLIFSVLRPNCTSSIETDSEAWQYILEEYSSATKEAYSTFYSEFGDYLMEFINEENELSDFGKYIERRCMLMYDLSGTKIVDID